jgi:hypothetical protein
MYNLFIPWPVGALVSILGIEEILELVTERHRKTM